MSVPITPQYLVNAVTIQRLELYFLPVWNGLDWVVDPANIEVRATVLMVDAENPMLSHTVVTPYTALDAAGKAQVDALKAYFEQHAADSF